MFKPVLKVISGAVLCLLAATAATAQNGAWSRQTAGTMTWLRSVFFINQDRGWAVGGKGTVLGTEDGGKTWKLTYTSFDDVVRDVFFTDSTNALPSILAPLSRLKCVV